MLGINLQSLSAGRTKPALYFRPTGKAFIRGLACCLLLLALLGGSLKGQDQAGAAPGILRGAKSEVRGVSKVSKIHERLSDDSFPSIRGHRELPRLTCAYRPVSVKTTSYTAATFSVDGQHVVLGSQAGIEIRSWPEMERAEDIPTSLEHVLDMSFSPDGRTLLIAGGSPAENGAVEVLDWGSRTILATMADHTDVVYQVAWSHDGLEWAAACADGRCTVIEAQTRATRVTFNGHSQSVLGLSWLAGGKQIASVSSDQTIRLWDSTTGRLLRTLDNHVGSVTRVALRPPQEEPPSDIIATISDDRTVRFWQPAVGRLIRFAKLDSIPRSLLWSHDGALLYVGCDDGNVRAIRFDDAFVEPAIAALSGPVHELLFSPDTQYQLAAGHGGTRVVETLKR